MSNKTYCQCINCRHSGWCLPDMDKAKIRYGKLVDSLRKHALLDRNQIEAIIREVEA